jgi:hypothetical protein
VSAGDEWANDTDRPGCLGGALLAVLLLPIVEWWDDLQPTERIHRVLRAAIAITAALLLLTGCNDTQPPPVEITGIDQQHAPFHTSHALETNR